VAGLRQCRSPHPQTPALRPGREGQGGRGQP
jgi:hypothetical protein